MDKKSKHVGNHGGTYTDMDGMSKQFTMVDHDKKPTIFTDSGKPEKDWNKKTRAYLVGRICKISASLCPDIFSDFTIRGDIEKIEWDMDMLLDNGIPLDKLMALCTILENRSKEKI